MRLAGTRLGVPFSCSVSLTLGLTGEFEARFVGGSSPSLTIAFLKQPVMQVLVCGALARSLSLSLSFFLSLPLSLSLSLTHTHTQVQTSGTQVSVASMPVPMQEAVDKEIRQHALKALQKAIFPPKIMSFELSTSAAAVLGTCAMGRAPLMRVELGNLPLSPGQGK